MEIDVRIKATGVNAHRQTLSNFWSNTVTLCSNAHQMACFYYAVCP